MSVFSVVIPAYNEERLIENALISLEMQDYKGGIEAIVIDNNSNDCTFEIAKQHKVRAYMLPKPQGASAARNCGGKFATGDYIAFLDADSFITKNALSEAARSLEKGYSGGTARIMTPHHSPLAKFQVGMLNFWAKHIGPTYTPFVYTTRENFLDSGGWDEDRELGEEFRFLEQISRFGPLAFNENSSVETSPRRYLKEGYLLTTFKGTLGHMGVNMKWPPVRD